MLGPKLSARHGGRARVSVGEQSCWKSILPPTCSVVNPTPPSPTQGTIPHPGNHPHLALLLVPSLSLGSTFGVCLHPKGPVNATPMQSTSCGPHLSTCSCPTGQPCHLSGASRANCTLSCNQLVSGPWETWVFQSQAGGQSMKPS